MIIDVFFYLTLIAHLIFTFITIYNFFSPLQLVPSSKEFSLTNEKISVLVPLRNEEENVKGCLESIFNQQLKNYEVICLDDHSTDRTAELLHEMKNKYKNLTVIEGEKLPEGWTGKNWACYQLANHSKGEFLVFIDADVRLYEGAISTAISQMKLLNASMLSIFPTQIMQSFGEFLVVPSMNWLLLTFLPLRFVYKFSHPSFVAANGQFIVLERSAYYKLNGHHAVKNEVVEDMELARKMKKNNFRIITLLGAKLISARMYKNFEDAFNGFSKNFYPGFKTSYFKFSLLLLIIFLVFVIPFFLFIHYSKFLIIIGLIILQRTLISIKSNQNILVNVLLSPLQLIMVIVTGIRSMVLTKKGSLTWKGRKLNIKS